MKKQLLVLAFAAFLSSPVLAQGDLDFCSRYAANMAGVGDLAIKKNPACLDYSKGVHANYKSHYDWCLKQSAASVQGAEANIRRLVSQCAGNSPPPKQREAVNRFSGTWIWRDRSRGKLPATIDFYPNRQGNARYCYTSSAGSQCFDVKYSVQGNAYVFTNNRVDWFSLAAPEPGVLVGKYWYRRADVNLQPSATITMRQTSGNFD